MSRLLGGPGPAHQAIKALLQVRAFDFCRPRRLARHPDLWW